MFYVPLQRIQRMGGFVCLRQDLSPPKYHKASTMSHTCFYQIFKFTSKFSSCTLGCLYTAYQLHYNDFNPACAAQERFKFRSTLLLH